MQKFRVGPRSEYVAYAIRLTNLSIATNRRGMQTEGYCRALTEVKTKVAGADALFSTQCDVGPNSANACPA